MLLKMVVEYCQCAEDIPTVAADLLTRLVDLLKVLIHVQLYTNMAEHKGVVGYLEIQEVVG